MPSKISVVIAPSVYNEMCKNDRDILRALLIYWLSIQIAVDRSKISLKMRSAEVFSDAIYVVITMPKALKERWKVGNAWDLVHQAINCGLLPKSRPVTININVVCDDLSTTAADTV